jgi:hypothetical protein
MSLSTFKRHFIVEYNEAPGNGCKISVSKSKRDSKGRSIKASDIYQDMATTIFLTSV